MCLEEDKDYTIEWKSSIKSFITDHGWSPKRRLEFRGEVVPTLQLSLRALSPFVLHSETCKWTLLMFPKIAHKFVPQR